MPGLALLSGLAFHGLASAASEYRAAFNITPLRLEVPSDRDSTQLLVKNESERALAIQARVFAWSQVNGEDQYSLSRNFVVSPSIIRIAPGRTQTLHVVAGARAAAGAEGTYRVVIDQLPESVARPSGGAATRIRMTVPLFDGSDRTDAAQIDYRIAGDNLLIHNSGGRTARFGSLYIGSRQNDNRTGPHYVLPGSTIRVPLPDKLPCEGTGIRISGQKDRENFDATVPQSCT